MEYGRTKTEASISSFDVGSSARSTKQKDFRRKMADMARGSEGTTMPISEMNQERTSGRQTRDSDRTRGKRESVRYGRQENYGEIAIEVEEDLQVKEQLLQINQEMENVYQKEI